MANAMVRLSRRACLSVAAAVALGACSGGSRSEESSGGTSSSSGGSAGVSTGGLTSSGGTTAGGGAGGVACAPAVGGVGGVPSACSESTVLTADQTLIADFECPSNGFDNGDGSINGYWHDGYVYSNSTDGTTCQPLPDVTVSAAGVDTPGHASERALHLNMDKPANNWGGGMGVWISGCLDASGFTGISFWAKGVTVQNTVDVKVRVFETEVPPKGSCTLATCNSPTATITLTPDWQQYSLAWSDFTPPDSPAGVVLDGSAILDIGFYVSTWANAENLDFWLDDLEFTGGSGSQIPRTCP